MLETLGFLTVGVDILRMISLQFERISSHLSGIKVVSVMVMVKMLPSDREKGNGESDIVPITYQS